MRSSGSAAGGWRAVSLSAGLAFGRFDIGQTVVIDGDCVKIPPSGDANCMTYRLFIPVPKYWAAGLLVLGSGVLVLAGGLAQAAEREPGVGAAPIVRPRVFSWQTAGPEVSTEFTSTPEAIRTLPPGAALTRRTGIIDPWGDGLNLQKPSPKVAARPAAPAAVDAPTAKLARQNPTGQSQPTTTPKVAQQHPTIRPQPVPLPVAKAAAPLTAGSQVAAPSQRGMAPRMAAAPPAAIQPRYSAAPTGRRPDAGMAQTGISRTPPTQPRLQPYAPAIARRFEAEPAPASRTGVVSALPPIDDAVARMAKQHIDRGVDLADRRAFFSARDEFIQALRLIAEARDAETQSSSHSQSLAAALRALDEADEFLPTGSSLEADVDVRAIASSHRTPVLKIMPVRGISAVAARQRYYTYAQEEFARAAARQPLASRALHSLGKLHTQAADQRTAMFAAAEPKAMACHQAALLADPQNPMAANELGVLLARYGRLEEARGWLERSIAIEPRATTWHNLAVVHQRLGQTEFADRARRNSVAARQNPAAEPDANVQVQWVKPEQFAAAGPGRAVAPHRSGFKPASEARRRETQVR